MATSIYTKAPVFVSTYQDDMRAIQEMDQRLDRIDKDYAIAESQLTKFGNSIDILRTGDKAYFDAKYNQAVEQFTKNVDLTKRNQVLKLEGYLGSISKDENIMNAIESTKNVRAINANRQKLKTSGKSRESDEILEYNEQMAYLNGTLEDRYSRSVNITTQDPTKLINDFSKTIAFESKFLSNGILNYNYDDKSFAKIYQSVDSFQAQDAAVRAGQQSDFAARYQTEESKKRLVGLYNTEVRPKQLERIDLAIKDAEKDLAVQQAFFKDPKDEKSAASSIDDIAMLTDKIQYFQQQRQILETEVNDPFRIYQMQNAFSIADSQYAQKNKKITLAPEATYFRNRDKDRVDEKYKYDVLNQRINSDNIAHQDRLAKISVDAAKVANASGSTTGLEGLLPINFKPGATSVGKKVQVEMDPENWVTTAPVATKFTGAEFAKYEKDLGDINRQLGTKLNQIFNHSSTLGAQFASNGGQEIAKGAKEGKFTYTMLENMKKIQNSLMENSSKKMELTNDANIFLNIYKEISQNVKTMDYKRGIANYIKGKTGVDITNPEWEGNWFERTIGKAKVEEARKLANELLVIPEESRSVSLYLLNDKTETGSAGFTELKANVTKLIKDTALVNNKGEYIRLPTSLDNNTTYSNGTNGSNILLSNEDFRSIDFENSISSVVVRNGKPFIELSLKTLGKDEQKSNNFSSAQFPGGVAYLPVTSEYANDIMRKIGKNVTVRDISRASDPIDIMISKDMSMEAKNNILKNYSTFGYELDAVGNYMFETQRPYFIDKNTLKISIVVAGVPITKLTNNYRNYIESMKNTFQEAQSKFPNATRDELVRYVQKQSDNYVK